MESLPQGRFQRFIYCSNLMDETYLFHQTPADCARDLIAKVQIQPGDLIHEPFKGEGAFYNNLPEPKDWAEIQEGKDYKELGECDWVISNPPFRLEGETGRFNAFWFLLDYFTKKTRKGIAFLGNDYCLATLTPRRLAILKERGWGISKIVVCSVKKWRGRYFLIIFQKGGSVVDFLPTNY